MLRISRGLAQISSTPGSGRRVSSAATMIGIGSTPGVGDAAGEHRDVAPARRPRARRRSPRPASPVISAVTLSLTPSCDEPAHQVEARAPVGVGDRDLHVDVVAPGRDLARLALHLVEVVGEDLERDRPVGDDLEHLAGERLVVVDARLAHQRRVGREARRSAGRRPACGCPSRSAPSAKIFTRERAGVGHRAVSSAWRERCCIDDRDELVEPVDDVVGVARARRSR